MFGLARIAVWFVFGGFSLWLSTVVSASTPLRLFKDYPAVGLDSNGLFVGYNGKGNFVPIRLQFRTTATGSKVVTAIQGANSDPLPRDTQIAVFEKYRQDWQDGKFVNYSEVDRETIRQVIQFGETNFGDALKPSSKETLPITGDHVLPNQRVRSARSETAQRVPLDKCIPAHPVGNASLSTNQKNSGVPRLAIFNDGDPKNIENFLRMFWASSYVPERSIKGFKSFLGQLTDTAVESFPRELLGQLHIDVYANVEPQYRAEFEQGKKQSLETERQMVQLARNIGAKLGRQIGIQRANQIANQLEYEFRSSFFGRVASSIMPGTTERQIARRRAAGIQQGAFQGEQQGQIIAEQQARSVSEIIREVLLTSRLQGRLISEVEKASAKEAKKLEGKLDDANKQFRLMGLVKSVDFKKTLNKENWKNVWIANEQAKKQIQEHAPQLVGTAHFKDGEMEESYRNNVKFNKMFFDRDLKMKEVLGGVYPGLQVALLSPDGKLLKLGDRPMDMWSAFQTFSELYAKDSEFREDPSDSDCDGIPNSVDRCSQTILTGHPGVSSTEKWTRVYHYSDVAKNPNFSVYLGCNAGNVPDSSRTLERPEPYRQ